jgi:Transcription termination factor nusG
MQGLEWHALLVRRRFEPIVVIHLHKRGIEHHLPLVKYRCSSDKYSGELSMFPGYVFCKCGAPDALLTIPGVLAVIRCTSEVQDALERDSISVAFAPLIEIQRG